MSKILVMDDLRDQYPEKFNESGAMDYKWFESDIRDNYDVFVRKDKLSITHQFKEQEKFDSYLESLTAKKQSVLDAEAGQAAAKKVESDPNLKYHHPLMNCDMNLLEISHRTIEVVEKYKLRVVGDSEGDTEADIEKFKNFLFDTLVKFRK